jgi:hypothetical protein|tara:strand:+ start:95 stop:946 length:852 start_codon:yes stop_codon:yes gene_type:complete
MASTYSDRLKLELQATGENAGTWGDKTNTNLQVLDAFAAGYLTKSVAGSSDVTLTTANASATSEASNKVIELTGTLTGNITVFIPAKENNYIFFNNTSGSHTLTIAATGHTANGVAITQGGHAEVYCDGSADFNVVNVFSSMGTISAKVLNMTGNIAVTDNNYINVGTGTDLQIYHDGTDSYIENNTGELNVKANNITVQSDTGETFLTMDVNDGVDIFHDNVKKFETTSAGATVTGALTVSTTVAATNIGNITSRNLITTTSTSAPSSGTGSNGDFYLIHDA